MGAIDANFISVYGFGEVPIGWVDRKTGRFFSNSTGIASDRLAFDSLEQQEQCFNRLGAYSPPEAFQGGVIEWSLRNAVNAKSTSGNVPAANSIQDDINKIRNAPHEAMPATQAARASLGGQTSMTVENGTNYLLYFYLSGPTSQKLEIATGRSQTLRLPPGHYEVAAKVSDLSVIPFYGTEDYAPNTGYSSHFYISTQPR